MQNVLPQVGSEVARRGQGLGFSKVIAYDPYASAAKASSLGVPLVTFDEALQQADFFSLHMPLTEGTKVSRNMDSCAANMHPNTAWLS